MQNHEEPDAEPGAACRTPFCKKIGGTADFEVNFLAPEEETDGLFLSYTVVQGTPSVCDALAKSRNEFSQAPQSHKVVLRRLPLKQEPKLNLQYYTLFFTFSIKNIAKIVVVMKQKYSVKYSSPLSLRVTLDNQLVYRVGTVRRGTWKVVKGIYLTLHQ